eukprot:3192868-Heterocapsa_arctica.AAC.1
MHQRWSHKVHDPLRLVVLANQCPMCYDMFVSRQQARARNIYYGRHTNEQVLKVRESIYDLVPLESYVCPFCPLHLDLAAAYNAHINNSHLLLLGLQRQRQTA